MSQPVIGITTYHELNAQGRWRYVVNQTYTEAVLNAGGIPVMIPLNIMQNGDTSQLRRLYERVDGILIPGGGDVHPEYYHEYITPKETRVDRNRDDVELTLAKWSFEDNQPVLGICRGHQVLNVALGGTLVHDIQTDRTTTLEHDQDDSHSPARLAHRVKIQPQSQLAKIIGVTELEVNSLHHQAVDQVAPPLQVTSHADDGIVESIESAEAAFCIGVQWHPEWLVANVPVMRNLFSAFVDACAIHAIQPHTQRS